MNASGMQIRCHTNISIRGVGTRYRGCIRKIRRLNSVESSNKRLKIDANKKTYENPLRFFVVVCRTVQFRVPIKH